MGSNGARRVFVTAAARILFQAAPKSSSLSAAAEIASLQSAPEALMVSRPAGPKRPRVPDEVAERIPPGQFLTERWPVLHYGSIPPFEPASWDLRVFGLVEKELRFGWDDLLALPRVTVQADMHCVTRWSKLDNTWEGISARSLIETAGVKPEARFVLFHCDGGYTANIPLDVFDNDDVLLALKHDGADLTPEHGFPLRVVVPQRYGWKSAKWIRAIEFMAEDRPGFWEQYGYSMNADHWKEERFAE
jgi:DMSO/TMAO reductase YedYZ molybdopterin-dependent catalytic subunit